uniref:Photosystem I reaction center subunit VIII n=6 Tax=Polygalaceae TaxID=4274 RepID=A0A7T7IEM7_9FABA|nr:photosystem I subunit VIII [Polygala tenuifolia]YP_009995844.1 PsaI [Polygala japonica]YP_010143077.1 photosystem I subunit VIII [Polygala karensium]YP_010143253.1 photosystem I subunit VIII [Polygala sibirica]YP_010251024.1 PsaI [Polygala crotalarioides]YP_010480880.1 PsaI [Polygala hongkongensis]AMC31513.1 photosystem I subunit VIII [Polygala alba]QNQ64782.1 PsaI [Polygala japonica]QNR95214.1 photosystem I subunit VIII [Polygala tenuifolia]QQL04197.1 photosystem I subunit VIII [Polyga
MTTFSNFPPIFVPLTGLVFPAITMVSLFLHLQRKKIF